MDYLNSREETIAKINLIFYLGHEIDGEGPRIGKGR